MNTVIERAGGNNGGGNPPEPSAAADNNQPQPRPSNNRWFAIGFIAVVALLLGFAWYLSNQKPGMAKPTPALAAASAPAETIVIAQDPKSQATAAVTCKGDKQSNATAQGDGATAIAKCNNPAPAAKKKPAVKPASSKPVAVATTAVASSQDGAATVRAMADELIKARQQLERVGVGGGQPLVVAAGGREIAPPVSSTKNVLVTFGHRCRIFNQEGNLLAQRYVRDEQACADYEANFRASIADPDATKSIKAYADK